MNLQLWRHQELVPVPRVRQCSPCLGAVPAAGLGALTGTGLVLAFKNLHRTRCEGSFSSACPAVPARATLAAASSWDPGLVPAWGRTPWELPSLPGCSFYTDETKSLGRVRSSAGALASALFIFGGCCYLAVHEHNSSAHNSVSLYFVVL